MDASSFIVLDVQCHPLNCWRDVPTRCITSRVGRVGGGGEGMRRHGYPSQHCPDKIAVWRIGVIHHTEQLLPKLPLGHPSLRDWSPPWSKHFEAIPDKARTSVSPTTCCPVTARASARRGAAQYGHPFILLLIEFVGHLGVSTNARGKPWKNLKKIRVSSLWF